MYLKKTVNIWLPILIILALVGATFLNIRLSERFASEVGFATRYMAAKYWIKTGLSPYSQETFEATLELLGESSPRPDSLDKGRFIDPATYVLFYIPLSFLPYPIAKAIWMTIIELSFILSAWLCLKIVRLDLSLIETLLMSLGALFFYPNLKMILSASILPFYIFLLVWAIWLAMNKQGRMAGVLFFLAFAMLPISLVIAIFFMIWMGARRDNSLTTIYFIGLLFMVLIALILFPNWIAEWFEAYLLLYPRFTWIDTPLMRVGELFPGASRQISIGLHVITIIYLFVEWYGLPSKEQRGLQWKLSLTILLLYLLNPLKPISYMILLFIPLFAIYKYLNEKWRVGGRIITWLSFLGIGVVYWFKGFNQETFVSAESTLIILLLALLCMLGLQYFRWWALKSSNALIETI